MTLIIRLVTYDVNVQILAIDKKKKKNKNT